MPSLAAFNNFVLSTGKKLKSSPDEIINDAVKNTYIISRMLKGRGVSDSVQSGQSIIERIQLKDAGTSIFYNPNQELDIQNVDTLSAIEIPWRFCANHYAYTEQEVKLNSGDAQTYYKNLLKVKRQQTVTDTFNFKEEALWAAANNANMEASSGTVPYSILAFVTTDGLAASGFTTIQGLDPALETGWRNQTETYDSTDITNPDTGLVQSFDNMFLKVRFRAPRPGEYFENDNLQQMMIATTREGRVTYLRLTRDSNDRLVGADLGGQAGPGLGYHGLPVEYIAELDNAGFTAGQPQYFFLNLKYLHPVWHATEYMVEKEPMKHPRQPFSMVVWYSTYYNICCTSRKRQGRISAS